MLRYLLVVISLPGLTGLGLYFLSRARSFGTGVEFLLACLPYFTFVYIRLVFDLGPWAWKDRLYERHGDDINGMFTILSRLSLAASLLLFLSLGVILEGYGFCRVPNTILTRGSGTYHYERRTVRPLQMRPEPAPQTGFGLPRDMTAAQ